MTMPKIVFVFALACATSLGELTLDDCDKKGAILQYSMNITLEMLVDEVLSKVLKTDVEVKTGKAQPPPRDSEADTLIHELVSEQFAQAMTPKVNVNLENLDQSHHSYNGMNLTSHSTGCSWYEMGFPQPEEKVMQKITRSEWSSNNQTEF